MKPRVLMPNFGTVAWMCIIVGAAFALYLVKYRVQEIKKDIAEINKQLDEEQESLHVVTAEWAYLNRPERLQQLSEKYLKLHPVKSAQIAGDVNAVVYPGEAPSQLAQKETNGIIQASMPTGGE